MEKVSPRTKLEELVGKKTYEKIKPAFQKSTLKGWQEICEVLSNETVLIEQGSYCNNLLFELCGDSKSKDCFRIGVDYYYPEAIYDESSLEIIKHYFSNQNDKWVKPSQSFKPFLLGVYNRKIYLVVVENDVLKIGNLISNEWEWSDLNPRYTFGFNINTQNVGISLGGWYSKKSLLFLRSGTICTFNFPRGD